MPSPGLLRRVLAYCRVFAGHREAFRAVGVVTIRTRLADSSGASGSRRPAPGAKDGAVLDGMRCVAWGANATSTYIAREAVCDPLCGLDVRSGRKSRALPLGMRTESAPCTTSICGAPRGECAVSLCGGRRGGFGARRAREAPGRRCPASHGRRCRQIGPRPCALICSAVSITCAIG